MPTEQTKKVKPIKDTQDTLVAKVKMAKMRALKEQDPEPMVYTNKEVIQMFMGPDYAEKYFMYDGVRVVEAETDIDAMLDEESQSIELKTKAF